MIADAAASPPLSRDRPIDFRRIANRLLDWSIEASRAGRAARAEYLLLRAWQAFERGAEDL